MKMDSRNGQSSLCRWHVVTGSDFSVMLGDMLSGESLRTSHWVKDAALTTLEAPTLKRCWWMVQEEASNTTTLPSFRAHHNLGCASSTFSAGSRRPEEESSPETFQSDQ